MALQGMTVTSCHVKKIMQDHGVAIPIVVSANGTDHWQRIIPDERVVGAGKKFPLSARVIPAFRARVDAMLQAYGRAFSASDDVTLIIKTFPTRTTPFTSGWPMRAVLSEIFRMCKLSKKISPWATIEGTVRTMPCTSRTQPG